MHASSDAMLTPRPIYKADGRKIPDCLTKPADLHGMKPLLLALRRGETVGLTPDQSPDGAGGLWSYKEPASGQSFMRSEGLAVASFNMFANGAFSRDAKGDPQALRTTFTSREQVDQFQRIVAWGGRTQFGDMAELASLPDDSPLLPLVTSTIDNCLGSECPFWDDCFVVQARQRAQAADIVVVNHHLLLADLALKQEGFGEILPGAQAFVTDEAHQLPELAANFFGEGFGMRPLQELARDCLAECKDVAGALSALQPPARALEQALREARDAEAMLARGVTPVVPAQGSVGASGDLAPLAHMAAVMIGEGEAIYQGARMGGGAALAAVAGVLLGPGSSEMPLILLMLASSIASVIAILFVIRRARAIGVA